MQAQIVVLVVAGGRETATLRPNTEFNIEMAYCEKGGYHGR